MVKKNIFPRGSPLFFKRRIVSKIGTILGTIASTKKNALLGALLSFQKVMLFLRMLFPIFLKIGYNWLYTNATSVHRLLHAQVIARSLISLK